MRLTNYMLIGVLCIAPAGALAGNSQATQPSRGLHLNWLDKSISPSQNFYKYANGNWQKNNPIPGAYSRWGTFSILYLENQKRIRGIIKAAAADKNVKPGSTTQKVGDFYRSGMDIKAIDKAGIKPLQPVFKRIADISNLRQLQSMFAYLQNIGVTTPFAFGSMQDLKDSNKVIGAAFQSGLGLPDRDYYLKQGKKFKKIREAYVKHIAGMFELLGDGKTTAAREAKTVMGIETNFARVQMSRIAQRKPKNTYHVMTLKQMDALTPNISWPSYFLGIGLPNLKSANIGMPRYFKSLSADLKSVPLAEWKTYLRWHVIDDFAPYLSKPFVAENFKMNAVLSGAKELRPRWQRVVSAENGALGFAIGKLYVKKYFPPSSKKKVLAILHNIRHALKTDLETLSWMSPATRKAALKKLSLMGERIGYPSRWRNYSKLTVVQGPYVDNIINANKFQNQRDLKKIGKPVDRNEWYMTPQTVNAYYDPSMNNINFPAGILQPPFFDPKASLAVNYGALGFVMGHEMTHGFDDQGALFNGHGNLDNWWTPQDKKKFNAATNCISNHFSKYIVDRNLHVQGHLVTGEATADLGGLTLAWRALHALPAYKNAKTIDGFTPDQQFFLGAAHVWASNIRPQAARNRVMIDPHPPARYRVNGTLANMPQFQKAFDVPNDSPMVNAHRCKIW
jgi:putative endopeptidase